MHPKALTLPFIRQYCSELGIRFLIVFQSRNLKTTKLVTIKDLHSDRSEQTTTPSARGRAGGASNAAASNSVFQVDVKDIRAFLRARFRTYAICCMLRCGVLSKLTHTCFVCCVRSGKRDETTGHESGGGRHERHGHSHSHDTKSVGASGGSASATSGSLLNVTIVDPFQSFKSFQKTNTVTLVKRALGPILQSQHTGPFLILAVDLPLSTIRIITQHFYQGTTATVESNKHKTLQDALLVPLLTHHSGTLIHGTDPPPSLCVCVCVQNQMRNFAKETSGVSSKLLKMIFVYSITEHSFDVVTLPPNAK